ncbi:MAG: DUF3185 domain-containing protein [Vicinamibacterales bacterium]
MKIIGLVLVVVGILGLLYGGITWTQREKVVDAGPIQISADKQKSIPLPPIVGGICLVAGAAMLLTGSRRS